MTDERIIAYLLGELPEEESERFEDECFAREEWPGELGVVEEELIEDYLRSDLTPERRRLFERNYLTTAARMERVRVAAALLRHVDEAGAGEEAAGEEKGTAGEEPGPESPGSKNPGGWFRSFWSAHAWAPAAAVALAAIFFLAGAWWLTRPPAPGAVATLTLSVSRADRAAGARPGRVTLTPETAALRLSLLLPEGQPAAPGYRVELEDEGGSRKAADVVGRDERAVTVEVPASRLGRGQFSLRLFAVQGDGAERRLPGSYFFTVE